MADSIGLTSLPSPRTSANSSSLGKLDISTDAVGPGVASSLCSDEGKSSDCNVDAVVVSGCNAGWDCSATGVAPGGSG